MDGLSYVRALDPRNSMPMAELVPPEAPRVLIRAKIVEQIDRTIVADASLHDEDGHTLAYAQCNCRIVSRQRRGSS